MLVRVPFVEKDTEIQNQRRTTSLLQSLYETFGAVMGADSTTDNGTGVQLGYVAAMSSRSDVIAVTCATRKNCRNGDVYLYSGGHWIFPPLTHPSQEAGILCMAWMPLSDILLCGTSAGVAMWSLCSLFERETDKSWVNLLDHPRGRPVHDIQVCPTGRLFATLSKGESDVVVFDSYLKTATALRAVSVSTCTELLWAPSGNFLLVGTHSGELVLFDADSWERNDTNVYELGSAIGTMCWLTAFSCLVVPSRSLHVYSYSTRGGAAAADSSAGSIRCLQGHDYNSIQNFPVHMSPIPLVLDVSAFESVLDASSVPWKDMFIADMKTDISSGLVAVSLSCTLEDRSDIIVAPVVVLYRAALSAFLNMTAVRVISFSSFNVDGVDIMDQQPVSFAFRSPRVAHKHRVPQSSVSGSSGRGRLKHSEKVEEESLDRLISMDDTPLRSADENQDHTNSLLRRTAAAAIAILWSIGSITIVECTGGTK